MKMSLAIAAGLLLGSLSLPCISTAESVGRQAVNLEEAENRRSSGTMTVTAIVAPRWDVNLDRVCDIGDAALLGMMWKQQGAPYWVAEDINGDGRVDSDDSELVNFHWLERY